VVTLEVGENRLDAQLETVVKLAWIYGLTIDDVSLKVVPSVLAEVLETGDSDRSDGGGLYVIQDIPYTKGQTPTYTVRFTHPDYETKEEIVAVGQWEEGELNVKLHCLKPVPPPEPFAAELVNQINFSWNTIWKGQAWNKNSIGEFGYGIVKNAASFRIKNNSDSVITIAAGDLKATVIDPTGKETTLQYDNPVTIKELQTGGMTLTPQIQAGKAGIYTFTAELWHEGELIDTKMFEVAQGQMAGFLGGHVEDAEGNRLSGVKVEAYNSKGNGKREYTQTGNPGWFYFDTMLYPEQYKIWVYYDSEYKEVVYYADSQYNNVGIIII